MVGLNPEHKLRDVFNARVIKDLAARIKRVDATFDSRRFVEANITNIDPLGFGERLTLVRDNLARFLPADYPKALAILLKALGPELKDYGKTDWDAFIIMPQCAFVSKFGKGHFDLSMNALYEMTKRFSAEGYLRTYIEIDYEKAMAYLQQWITDPNPHVRRLVSEGTRPRLPLAGRIPRFQKDPRPVLMLLEKLKQDPELYVRRSVANNLNDISKDHPDLIVKTLKIWAKDPHPQTQWIIRHALRTLIKSGHQGALSLLGYKPLPEIKVTNLTLKKDRLKVGEDLVFSFEVIAPKSMQSTNLVIDFVIDFLKANGAHKGKVFKLKNVHMTAGKNLHINKKIPLRNTANRKIYPGIHHLKIQINGRQTKELSFRIHA